MIPDPYAVLGVSPTATEEEIKTAYRRLAKQYHPDLHPGDPAAAAKMNKINQAYEQIKNPQPQQQNRAYNPYGSAQSPYGDPAGTDPFSSYGWQVYTYRSDCGAGCHRPRRRGGILRRLFLGYILFRLILFFLSALFTPYHPYTYYFRDPCYGGSQYGPYDSNQGTDGR